MEIFVGNLPQKSDAFEIGRLFERAIKPRGLSGLFLQSRMEKRRSESPPRYEVVETGGENPVRYGYVVLKPDDLARQVLADLKGATLRGEAIYLREFVRRAYINDRRLLGWRDRHWNGVERRLGERRQGHADIASSI